MPRSTHLLALLTGLLVVLPGGCPPAGPTSADVVARIGVSSTRGQAPLLVVVTGANSTSVNGEIVAYTWDFGGQATADTKIAQHTFNTPGRFNIGLTVTDETGKSAQTSVEIIVGGSASNSPTAIIRTNVDAGDSPLVVQFNGRDSFAPDDTIRDYYWDFGDGATSRRPTETHVYLVNGVYEVTLRVVTAGGLEGFATRTIRVGGALTSLEFSGSQFASLALTPGGMLGQLTFEAWFRADAGGGTVASMGSQFSLVVSPNEASGTPTSQPSSNPTTQPAPKPGVIRFIVGGVKHELAFPNLGSGWKHIAVAYSNAGITVVYVNGQVAGELDVEQGISSSDLTLGDGFRGRLAEIRVWSTYRSQSEIQSALNARLDGNEDGLLGYWPIWERSGQILGNYADVNFPGILGASRAEEVFDPTWSGDGPSLP